MSPVAEVRADFEVFGTDFFWPCPSGNPYFDQIRGFITTGKVAGRWYRSKQVQTNHGVAMSGLGPNIWYLSISHILSIFTQIVHAANCCNTWAIWTNHDKMMSRNLPSFQILPDWRFFSVDLPSWSWVLWHFVACFSMCSSAAQPKDPWRHRHFDRPWAGQGMCWWNERLSSFAEGSNWPNSQWCLAGKK